jgi:hypothetical protein
MRGVAGGISKLAAVHKKLHAAEVRRGREFLRSIGVADLSAEEITGKARAATGYRALIR